MGILKENENIIKSSSSADFTKVLAKFEEVFSLRQKEIF